MLSPTFYLIERAAGVAGAKLPRKIYLVTNPVGLLIQRIQILHQQQIYNLVGQQVEHGVDPRKAVR